MTDTMISHNIDLSSWDTLYIGAKLVSIFFSSFIKKFTFETLDFRHESSKVSFGLYLNYLTANNFVLLLFCFRDTVRNIREQCCGRFETLHSLHLLDTIG
jgi:hypothetical protein